MTEFEADVEKRLDAAIEHAVPDVLPEILARCDEETIAEITPIYAEKKRRPWAKRAVSLAAAFALVVAMAFGFSRYQAAYAVENVVTLGEGENAVELALNRRDEVIGVKSGAGADEAVEGLSLKGLGITEAAEILAEAMGERGMMSDPSGVTVEGKDGEKMAELQALVTSAVTEAVAKTVENAANAATEAVDALTEGDVAGALDKAGEAVNEAIGGAGELVGEALEGAGEAVSGAGDIIEDTAAGAGGIVSAVTDGIGGFLKDIGDWFGKKE